MYGCSLETATIISQLLVATSTVLPVLAVGGVFLAYKYTARLPASA